MNVQNRRLSNWKLTILVAGAVVAATFLLYWFWTPLLEKIRPYYALISDRQQFEALIISCGVFAPLVFVLFQILQVLFAPFPGEATGFMGGYIFGAVKGFFLSTIGLTIGSLVNFLIGRYLGKRFVRRLIPPQHLTRFNGFLKHQGILIIFFLFVFPGFPKDYLCLFLGLSTLSLKVFLILATIGRMPGTLMLSLQGAYLFERNYLPLGILAVVSLIILGLAYRYRNRIYAWVERLNHNAKKNG